MFNILLTPTSLADRICPSQFDIGINESTGGLLGDKKDPPCDIKVFSKIPCECANREPKINQFISKHIRQPLMREQKLEDRVLSATKIFWERRIQNMFHDVLFFDAILTDPKMKHIYENGYSNPKTGAQNMVRNMGQCSLASMEKNWKEAFEPDTKNKLFAEEWFRKGNGTEISLQKKCKSNKTLAEARFKKIFGSNDVKSVLGDSYKKNLTAISNNELLAPAQCLPYKGFTQVSAIPSNAAFLMGQKKSDGSFMDKDTYIMEQEKKIKLKKSELLVVDKKSVDYEKKSKELTIEIAFLKSNLTNFMTSVASNPILGTLFSSYFKTTDDKNKAEKFRKMLIGKTDSEIQALLSDPKQVEPLLKISMEKQNDKCAEIFAVALPRLLCQDEIIPTVDMFDNADLSDFDELDQRTFFMTTMCEKKDGEWRDKLGVNKRLFNDNQSNYQTPLEGFELFSNKVNDKKINNKEVVTNNAYSEADKLFCKLAPECVPKDGVFDPKCSDPKYMHDKFFSFIESDFKNSSKNGTDSTSVEEKNWATQFAFYYGGFLGDQTFNCQVTNTGCNPNGNQSVPNLAATNFYSSETGESSVFTNYVVGSTISDYENLSTVGTTGTWKPIENDNGRVVIKPPPQGSETTTSNAETTESTKNESNSEKTRINIGKLDNPNSTSSGYPINTNVTTTNSMPTVIASNAAKTSSREDTNDGDKLDDKRLKELNDRYDRLSDELGKFGSVKPGKKNEYSNDFVPSYRENAGHSNNNHSSYNQPNNFQPNSYSERNPLNYPSRENTNYETASGKKDRTPSSVGASGGAGVTKDGGQGGNISAALAALGFGNGLHGGFGFDGEFVDEERIIPHKLIVEIGLKDTIRMLGLEGKRFRSIEHINVKKERKVILRTYDLTVKDSGERAKFNDIISTIRGNIKTNRDNLAKLEKLQLALDKVAEQSKMIEEKSIQDGAEIEYLSSKTMTRNEIMYYINLTTNESV